MTNHPCLRVGRHTFLHRARLTTPFTFGSPSAAGMQSGMSLPPEKSSSVGMGVSSSMRLGNGSSVGVAHREET
jgi:hypothetical protein